MGAATSASIPSSTRDKISSMRMTAPTMFTVPEATKSAGIRNSSSVSYSAREVTQ